MCGYHDGVKAKWFLMSLIAPGEQAIKSRKYKMCTWEKEEKIRSIWLEKFRCNFKKMRRVCLFT